MKAKSGVGEIVESVKGEERWRRVKEGGCQWWLGSPTS